MGGTDTPCCPARRAHADAEGDDAVTTKPHRCLGHHHQQHHRHRPPPPPLLFTKGSILTDAEGGDDEAVAGVQHVEGPDPHQHQPLPVPLRLPAPNRHDGARPEQGLGTGSTLAVSARFLRRVLAGRGRAAIALPTSRPGARPRRREPRGPLGGSAWRMLAQH